MLAARTRRRPAPCRAVVHIPAIWHCQHRPLVPLTSRTIFLSDIHLGTRGCQAERLLEFLREHHESEYLFLIGDIVDFWAMSARHPLDRVRRTPWCRRSCAGRATARG
ncbi:MAG: hypothetical protein MZW92_47700 [Comamonadaceae bacterium]|nr:hypothetical protein [Comamonadaceae bacterium]